MSKHDRGVNVPLTAAVVAGALSTGAAVSAAAVAPSPVLSLPRDVRTVDEAVTECQLSGLTGWDLVNYATALVNAKMSRYSLWTLWESAPTAFAHSRGFSYQYNMALGIILRRLGFQVRPVHAARVRFDPPRDVPWWATSHAWLEVTHDGQTLDVCASDASNRAGRVTFTSVSDIRPMNPWTAPFWRFFISPFSVATVWGFKLRGETPPRWFYRSFHGWGTAVPHIGEWGE